MQTHRQLRISVAALLLAASAAMAQPPEEPAKEEKAKTTRETVAITKDGRVTVVEKDANGKILLIETAPIPGRTIQVLPDPTQTEGGRTGRPPATRVWRATTDTPVWNTTQLTTDPGSLAVNNGHVFVLLNGVLYQYDADTLKLENKARVEEPAKKAVLPLGTKPVAAKEGVPTHSLGVICGAPPKEPLETIARVHPPGALVEAIVAGTAAQRAGVQVGDIITGLNRDKVNSPKALGKLVRATKPGAEVTIEVHRDGERLELKAKID